VNEKALSAQLGRLLAGIVTVAAVGGIAGGQAAQVPSAPAFEVASIKPNNSGRPGTTMGTQPGTYRATNVNLRTLIVNAYHLQAFQLSGGPRWITSDRFDIVARITAGVPVESALKTLLADRFKLVMHNERRAMSAYALVAARGDKKLGPRIHPAATDCDALAAQSTLKQKDGKGKTKEERGNAIPAPLASGQRHACTFVTAQGRMSASGMTMATLGSSLSGVVQRTVLDRTGITGMFDMELTWTPDQMPQGSAGADPKGKGSKVDPNGPSIFTALREQLGLKLESTKTKGSVDVLVIDHVEHPNDE
jgi:uncharacterized protein (TIGR03435 family)